MFERIWSSSEPYEGKGVVADSRGNIYVVGSGWPGVVLLRYDSAGRLLWERKWTGGEDDRGNGIAVDSAGSIYVVGMTYSGSTRLDQLLLLKFDSNGNLVWQKAWGSSYEVIGYKVAVDPSTDSIFVTGSNVLLKFDSDGGLDWAVGFAGGGDSGQDMAVDSSGVYVASGIVRSFPLGDQAMILRFSLNGSLLWTRSWGDAGYTWSYGIALDAMHNVYVTGGTGPDSDVFLLGLNSSGSLIWQRTWGGPAYDRGLAIASSTSGGVYLTGATGSLGTGGPHLLLLNFAANGTLVSQQAWGGHDSEEGDGITVASDNGVLITGIASGPPYRLNSTSLNLGYPSSDLLSLSSFAEAAQGTLDDPAGAVTVPSGTELFNGQTSLVLLKYGYPAAPVPLIYRVIFITNASGSITFYWSTYRNEETNYFTAGTYDARANPPFCHHFCLGPNYVFLNWKTTGAVWVESASCNPTRVTVEGTGTLEAVFTVSGASTLSCLISNPIFLGTIIVLTSATLLILMGRKRLNLYKSHRQ